MEQEIWKNLSLEDLPNEEWRDVIGYEGSYQVSNMGRVKSLPTQRFKKRKRILRQSIVGNGYLAVKLQNGSNPKSVRVHQLVAQSFLPLEKGKDEINHINENKLDNRLSNIERCDRLYNVHYGSRIINISYKLRNRPDQSLAVQQVDEKGNILRQFRSIAEASRFYNCFPAAIWRVCRGKRRKFHNMYFIFKKDNYGNDKEK